MKPVEPKDYAFQDIEIKWSGPFVWPRESPLPNWEPKIADSRGWYRVEQSGRERQMIMYIGSTSGTFCHRLRGVHRVKLEILDRSRETKIFFGTHEKKRMRRTEYVEIEYILQNVTWRDLISYHGLSKLPKTSRGMAWRIKNSGNIGSIPKYIHYPCFLIANRLKDWNSILI